ncbi:MAG: hypothetical protein ACI87E_001623 [Mariniblastus sp.]|jgi:hypothetical protein
MTSICNPIDRRNQVSRSLARNLSTRHSLLIMAVVVLTSMPGCQFVNTVTSVLPCKFPWQSTTPQVPAFHPPTFSSYVSPLFTSNRIRRIVLIESGERSGSYGETDRMINELANEFRSSGLFDAVAPANERILTPMDSIMQGRFNEGEIARIARKYNADAVALVRVNELRAHAPMRASLTMAMIDSRETVVAYAIDGVWDTSHEPTLNNFKEYIGSQGPTIPGPTGVLIQSPRVLMEFSAQEISQNIQSSMR